MQKHMFTICEPIYLIFTQMTWHACVHACMLLPTFHVLKQWSGFKKYSTITFILLWFLLCLHLCSCWVANSTYLLVYYTRSSKYSAKKLICFVTCNKCVNERTEKKVNLVIFCVSQLWSAFSSHSHFIVSILAIIVHLLNAHLRKNRLS